MIYGDLIDNVDFLVSKKVDIVFAGSDHKNEDQFNKLNVEIMIFPYTAGISTTKIIERLNESTL